MSPQDAIAVVLVLVVLALWWVLDWRRQRPRDQDEEGWY